SITHVATLLLHDALPICSELRRPRGGPRNSGITGSPPQRGRQRRANRSSQSAAAARSRVAPPARRAAQLRHYRVAAATRATAAGDRKSNTSELQSREKRV